MPFNSLPRELHYDILSHLAQEDLRSCALTCRALLPPAQAGLFRTISPLYHESAAETVVEKLEYAPHLGAYIRHLKLYDIHKPWIQTSEALPKLFTFLSPSIFQSLHVEHRRRKTYPRFGFFSSLSRLEFLTEISITEKTPLARSYAFLCGDNALPILLNGFPMLRVITFDQCFVGNKRAPEGSGVSQEILAPGPIFHLEKMKIEICEDTLALEWLIPALSSLQTLCIRYPHSVTDFICTIFPKYLAAAGQSLQHLEVDLYNVSDEGLKLFSSAVQVHAASLRSFNMTNRTIQQVVQMLLFIDAHACLRHLTISIYPYEDYPYEEIIENSPWDELQDLVLSGRFPALRCLELCFLASSKRSKRIPTKPIFAALPRLVQKRILYVSMMGHNK